MTESKLREEICRFGRSLFERGLTPGSSGNISVKLDDGGWLVTPTNASLGFLDPARMSRLDAGRLVSGDAPTKEVPLHTALYQTRSAARAVVHLHSTHSVALYTLEAAVFAMEELEETAKLYLLLRGLNPRYLSPEQVADLTKVFGLSLPEHGR